MSAFRGLRGEMTAHLCMAAIGVGYLFPISAIWAAFDYWKELLPDGNIEFEVTAVYQAVSLVTVAALSLSKSVALGPRIIGGFAGQFATLAAILSFRWLHLDPTTLTWLLMVLVTLCSVATGYLDSALLMLCSQYSPKMQQYLQIGIGFGTLVSVVYRDLTKLLMPWNIADATSFYFVMALMTVLVCVACYKLLMSLPVSRGICSGDETGEKLLGAHSDDVRMPLTPAAGGFSPGRQVGSPLLDNETGHDETLYLEANGQDAASMPQKQNGATLAVSARKEEVAEPPSSFGAVFPLVWKNHLVTFLNFVLTTLCYPGLLTSIPCRQLLGLRPGHWFQTLLLTSFTVFDIFGRFLTHVRFGLNYENIWLTVAIRLVVFPLMLYCAISDSASDVLALVVAAIFGCFNGYCGSQSLILVNEVPGLTPDQRKTCGRMSACAVNGGLCVGSLAAAALALLLGLGS